MRASYLWLKELSGVDATASDFAERLTRAGLEVESHQQLGAGLERVVVAEVRSVEPHPSKSNLRVVTVWDGTEIRSVVCGAPNVPPTGQRVLFAPIGVTLPNGVTLAERAIAGVTSRGMLCSEAELGIGPNSDEIVVLGPLDKGAAGAALADVAPVYDAVLEVSLTPNRPDGLGHIGLARELAVLFGAPPPDLSRRAGSTPIQPTRNTAGGVQVGTPAETFQVELHDVLRCPRYALAGLGDVRVVTSPLWVRTRLHQLGIRAINHIVDATNWTLLEWGYPTHAFDADRIRGGRIDVRVARGGELCRTLDGIDRTLDADDLVIADLEGPIAIAGVMGGQGSEVVSTTRRIWLECGWFDPRSVRRTSRRLAIHTEASHRFERGVDVAAVPQVLSRVIAWIGEFSGVSAAAAAVDLVPEDVQVPRTLLRRTRLHLFPR